MRIVEALDRMAKREMSLPSIVKGLEIAPTEREIGTERDGDYLVIQPILDADEWGDHSVERLAQDAVKCLASRGRQTISCKTKNHPRQSLRFGAPKPCQAGQQLVPTVRPLSRWSCWDRNR